ncbi:DUF6931 family protein [Thalassotalea euphylliae]|uniref:Uncharacterized protein n=1 Tax=Thalassotalea euphylliae TaxID=1655234 RepID=A0A3E0U1A9_9GAMM|nr:hypothetical protein [Thalassotalea euphylliae]REL30718.1 hypothetical protein DXX94_08315 [Thalassotalea euphylliae]
MQIITPKVVSQLTQTNAGHIVNRYPMTDEAKALVTNEMTPSEAVEKLQQAGLERDAIQFIAHGLSVMSAIKWGLSCLRQKIDWQADDEQIFDCVERWVNAPNETLRIRAQQLSDRKGLGEYPSAWLGYAVFWSGTGSIAPPDLPAVMPPDNMVGHAINAAILMVMI